MVFEEFIFNVDIRVYCICSLLCFLNLGLSISQLAHAIAARTAFYYNMFIFSFFVLHCICQYIDEVNEENWQNMLININFCQYFNEHILPIFLINFINTLAKTIKYKESFNSNFSKTVSPIWLKFESNRPTLISNKNNFILPLIPP